MTDIALYRASESVGGYIDRALPPDELGRISVSLVLDRPVDVVLMVTVNGLPSPSIEIYGERKVIAKVPQQLVYADPSELVFVVIAEVSFELINETPVPTSIGIGLKPSLINNEAEALQTAVRSLYMDPGTDIWNPSRGGGLRSLRSQLVGRGDEARLAQIVNVAIDRYNATAGRLRSFGRSRTSVRRTVNRYRVARMQLQSLRILTQASAQAQLGSTPAIGSTREDIFRNVDPSDPVIVTSILMFLQGPEGSTEQVSSSLTV